MKSLWFFIFISMQKCLALKGQDLYKVLFQNYDRDIPAIEGVALELRKCSRLTSTVGSTQSVPDMGKQLSGRRNDFLSGQIPDKIIFVRTMSELSGRTKTCHVRIMPLFRHFKSKDCFLAMVRHSDMLSGQNFYCPIQVPDKKNFVRSVKISIFCNKSNFANFLRILSTQKCLKNNFVP